MPVFEIIVFRRRPVNVDDYEVPGLASVVFSGFSASFAFLLVWF